jgi:phosphate transport system substrate-binding protein
MLRQVSIQKSSSRERSKRFVPQWVAPCPTGRSRLCVFPALLVGITSALVPGCSDQSDKAPPIAKDRIVIKGSNTVGEELGPALIADYKKSHSQISIELESRGTGYGIAALMAGQCNIACASREPIKDELSLAESRNVRLNGYVIGAYSVAVVVNASNPVTNLSRAQVRDIFTGVSTNWKDLGGPDAPIELDVRDPVSGTYLGFKELAMENQAYGGKVRTFTNYVAIVQAVSENANSIGYSRFDLAGHAGVRAVAIQGVAPSAAAVNEGKYPYARLLRLYTDKAREPDSIREFIQFVLSKEGQAIVAGTGNIPRS